ncbi:hypothetical protein GGR21_001943 [Dysgonomonas hofstadii]|uniref:Homeodomain phBC6A51-type domain-containing protein n=1 Tax=Dysgonomonas hofstadii TaxID=637886 RepID=A0A840CU63_9BACT|nr:bacteriophage terminase small subunit [Dysgonomonas hofstadii]MBB4036042.1 hypothetical protein [Dysgonomonas hofstadii]
MAKYNEKLVSRIERLIEADLYTISEICTAMKISRNTFYYWKEKNPDFRRRVDEAEERRDDELVKIARSSLKKKLTGYTTIEEHCTYQPAVSNPSVMILKKKVVKTKQKDPDLRAINYVLEREEKRKEKEKQEKPKLRQQIIYVRNQHEADLFIKLDKHLNGEDSQVIRMATKEERERIENEEPPLVPPAGENRSSPAGRSGGA